MRILYIAPVLDFSGYANAARGYVRALNQAGADLVVRAIRYDRADLGKAYQPTELERSILRKPLENIDVVIQHTTPNESRPVPGKINVAVVAWETTRIPEYWARRLNEFNAVMTFCDASVQAFRDSGVTVPIYKIPHTFDIASYTLDDIEAISSPSDPNLLKDKFVFYNISQLSAKKGVDVLLRAYYAQFHGQQDVVLILKAYIDMQSREAEQKKIQGYVNSVKQAMRLDPKGYPPVMVITSTLNDHQIKKLHKTGHCYVCSSRAEGWCIPAFEALAYGRKLVTTTWGGMGEFALSPEHRAIDAAYDGNVSYCAVGSAACRPNVFPVSFSMEPLVGQQHGDPDLYTSRDLVAEPSVRSMMQEMQAAKDTALAQRADLMEYDYSNVGPQMLEMLKEIHASKENANV